MNVYPKSQIPPELQRYFKPAEYGLESSPAEYIETMRGVFAEVRRVLADDGTLFVNLGDSFSTGRPSGGGSSYGTSDRALADCRGGDCPSSCRCDGHRECVTTPNHTARTDNQRALGSVAYADGPSLDHTESPCLCPGGSDSTRPSQMKRSSLATLDQRQTPVPAIERPHASQSSSSLGSSQQHLDECSHSGSHVSDPPVPGSFVCGVPQCGRSWVCTCGTPQTSEPSADRRTDKESSGSAWGDSTRTFPPAKNLLGIPWRTAFALQDDGWILRNDIIWAKANGMPESITDRLATRHEHVFMFSKSPRYWFGLDAIREPHSDATLKRAEPHRAAPGKSRREGLGIPPGNRPHTARLDQINHPNGRNPGDVWTLPTQPFPKAHFACMPLALAERCILAGCKPGGIVLDPFSGSGTTGLAATKHGRKYVGIDLSKDYLDLSLRTRFVDTPLDMSGESA